MKRLFLATTLTGALLVLGVMAVPAGAFKAHAISPSALARLSHHSGRAHRLSAAQLRKDKAGAVALLRSLKSHRAHAAQVFYYGSVWSDPMAMDDLYDENNCDNIAPDGGQDSPDCYFTGGGVGDNNDCGMITNFTFQYGLYSCIYVREDYYEDTSNGEFYGFQLLCGTYAAGQETDVNGAGCQYADTYSIIAPSGSEYGLFTYEG